MLKERYANSFQATVESMTLDFDHLGNLFFAYVIDFAGAMLIAVVGWWLAGVIERGTRRALMLSPHMDLTVGTFLSSLARYATLVIVFVIILQVIGVGDQSRRGNRRCFARHRSGAARHTHTYGCRGHAADLPALPNWR